MVPPAPMSMPASALSDRSDFNLPAVAMGAHMKSSARKVSSESAAYGGAMSMQVVDGRPMVRDFKEVDKEMKQEAGKDAVGRAKSLDFLKSSTVAYKGDAASAVKVVEDKTFYCNNGVWTDSNYVSKLQSTLKKVVFGSTAYFDLVRKNPGIAKYLSVGQKVILIFNGTAYEITAPETEQS